MLTMLLVLVTGVGGPPTAQKERGPDAPALGSVIEVVNTRFPELTATSRFGSLQLELEPGTYTVTARVGSGERPCGLRSRRVSITRHPVHARVPLVRVHIFCSIP